jgi:hypothetical protein
MSPTKNHILIGLSESPQTKFGKEDFSSQSAANAWVCTINSISTTSGKKKFACFYASCCATCGAR